MQSFRRTGAARRYGALLAGALIPCLLATAHAAGVVFAGGTATVDPSVYAGLLTPLPGARLGKGLAIRGSGNAGQFAYDAGRRVRGRYYGGEVSLMLQGSGTWGYGSVAAGPRYSYLRLTPDDPGNRRRGSRFDALLSTDGALMGGPWRGEWYGAYGTGIRDYQVRLGIAHDLVTRTRLGLEGGVQGDPTYSRRFGGLTLAIDVGQSTFRLGGGMSDQASRGRRAYLSLGFSRSY